MKHFLKPERDWPQTRSVLVIENCYLMNFERYIILNYIIYCIIWKKLSLQLDIKLKACALFTPIICYIKVNTP
jgi:hypothetical protein